MLTAKHAQSHKKITVKASRKNQRLQSVTMLHLKLGGHKRSTPTIHLPRFAQQPCSAFVDPRFIVGPFSGSASVFCDRTMSRGSFVAPSVRSVTLPITQRSRPLRPWV